MINQIIEFLADLLTVVSLFVILWALLVIAHGLGLDHETIQTSETVAE